MLLQLMTSLAVSFCCGKEDEMIIKLAIIN